MRTFLLEKNELRAFLPAVYFIAVAALTLFTRISYLSVILLFPLVLFKRDWIISVLFFSHLLKGALTEPLVLGGFTMRPLPPGVLTVLLLLPLLLVDIPGSKKKVPPVYFRFFGLFALLVISGFFVHVRNFGYDPRALYLNILSLAKLLFSLLLVKYFVIKGRDFLERSFINVLTVIAPVIFLICLQIILIGDTYSPLNYLVFGHVKHGIFTATLSAFSVYVLYLFRTSEKNRPERIFYLATLVFAFCIIILMASMNGLLSFSLMLLAGHFFFSRTNNFLKRTGVAFAISFFLLLFLYLFFSHAPETPLFIRLQRTYSPERLMETPRAQQALAVLRAFPEAPFFGWGSSHQAAQWVSETYGAKAYSMHNIFLAVLVKHGLVGIIVYAGFLIMLFRKSRDIYRHYRARTNRLLFLPSLCFWLLLFSGMFVPWLWNTLLWYNVALIMAAHEALYS